MSRTHTSRGIWLSLLLVAWAPAQATVIGVAVGPNGAYVPNSTNDDGSINFFALLNGSGTYGVAGAGMHADTCTIWSSTSSTCTGGTLDMWLRFAPVTLGANILTLEFDDLDLFGVNSPDYFLESVRIYNSSGSMLALVDDIWDPEVRSANLETQTLELALNVLNDPYLTRLRFRTRFDSDAPRGTYINTVETVLATMSAVPTSVTEPATLSLLGGGLLLIGFASRRRRV